MSYFSKEYNEITVYKGYLAYRMKRLVYACKRCSKAIEMDVVKELRLRANELSTASQGMSCSCGGREQPMTIVTPENICEFENI